MQKNSVTLGVQIAHCYPKMDVLSVSIYLSSTGE